MTLEVCVTSELSLIRNLTSEQRHMFESQRQAVRESPSTALLLSLFGLSRFYLDELGLGAARVNDFETGAREI